MGRAKQRGSLEKRIEQSIDRQQLEADLRRIHMMEVEANRTPEQRAAIRKYNMFATIADSISYGRMF
jgi:hypothetical protein